MVGEKCSIAVSDIPKPVPPFLYYKGRLAYSNNSKLKSKDREDIKISLSYNESVLNNNLSGDMMLIVVIKKIAK